LEVASYESEVRIIKFEMASYNWKCDQFI